MTIPDDEVYKDQGPHSAAKEALKRMATARLHAKQRAQEEESRAALERDTQDNLKGAKTGSGQGQVDLYNDPSMDIYKQHMTKFDAEYPQRAQQRASENRGFIRNIQSKEDDNIKGSIRHASNSLRGDHSNGMSDYENDPTSNRLARASFENQPGGADNSLEDTEPTANLASLTDKNNPGLGYSAEEKSAAARLAAQRKMVEDAMSNNGMKESVNRTHPDSEIEGLMKGNVPFAYMHADDTNPDVLSTSKETLGIDPKDWYRPRNSRPNQITRILGPGDDDYIPDEFK